ncbi:MAG: zinc ABC transporter substrate-binding protein [Solirubrobacteraceae bacterium]|nr:zinc ABC transporter substrate-binding protein [Solirubrobacteraceae bacterium]
MAASFTPLHELATRIGGERVEATNLTPIGGQPHDLVPPQPALDALRRAKLVLYLGGTFQPAVDAAVAKLPATTTKLDLATDATLPNAKPIDGTRGVVEGAPVDGSGTDPHVWLDPERFATAAKQTQDALIAADPEHRAEYQTRGGRYLAELTRLGGDYKQQLQGCGRGVLLTTHPAWGYLAARYGLEQAVVAGITPGASITPATLEALARYARRERITTLFTTVPLPTRQTRVITRETGLRVQVLDPFEGLTQEQRDQGTGYVDVMRENLVKLRDGLACDPGTTPTPTTPESTTPQQ